MSADGPANIMDYVQPTATGGAEGGGAGKADWWKVPLLAAALVILAIAIIWYIAKDAIAKRLADKGWVLYVMPGCGACAKQEEVLGYYGYLVPHYPFSGAGEYLGDPKTMPPPVSGKAIKGYPTWYNTKTKQSIVGAQNEIALAKMVE